MVRKMTFSEQVLAVLSTIGGTLLAIFIIEWLWGLTPAYWITLFLFVGLCARLIQIAIKPEDHQVELEADHQAGKGYLHLFVYPVLVVASFSLFSRTVWLYHGNEVFVNTPENPNLFTWIVYGLERPLDVVSFGAFEVFGIRLTSVRHANTSGMNWFVLSYQVALSLGFLRLLISSFGMTILGKRDWDPSKLFK